MVSCQAVGFALLADCSRHKRGPERVHCCDVAFQYATLSTRTARQVSAFANDSRFNSSSKRIFYFSRCILLSFMCGIGLSMKSCRGAREVASK